MKKLIYIFLTAGILLASGCQKNDSNLNNYNSVATEAPTQEIKSILGEQAQLDGMDFTVISAENPDIIMQNTGKQALFFKIEINNQTEETVIANYLNNFSITVDGTEYDSDICCTIPVMKELYDFYGISAMAEEIPAGESRTGYIACEADKDFQEISLHYTPKINDVGSRITVPLSSNDIISATKN
ncbi:MAG: DUF4352 domain-containing protein [Oscillospiraceae bacterium]|nr:DUF4352 domain-containing protein [Oscillospiraceae bacterium]